MRFARFSPRWSKHLLKLAAESNDVIRSLVNVSPQSPRIVFAELDALGENRPLRFSPLALDRLPCSLC